MIDESTILFPPRIVFKDDGLYVGTNNAHPESTHPIPEAVAFEFPAEGGILMYYKDFKFPKKQWVFKQALLCIDSVKSAAINIVSFLISKPMRYFLPFAFFFPSILDSGIEQFFGWSDRMFKTNGVYWKPNYYSTMVREVYRVGMRLARTESRRNMVESICMILEFDDAYRWFVQDMACEMNLEDFFDNPGKEMGRLFGVAMSRGEGTAHKFEKFKKIIPYLFRIPKFRNAMVNFFADADMEKLYLDEADWYWCYIWKGYDFGGYSFEARRALRNKIDADWVASGKQFIDSNGNPLIIPKQEDVKG